MTRGSGSSPAPEADVSGAGGPWPAARVARLTALWRDGDLTAAEIARRLGVSRNAVLGKVHRLGLSNRRTPGAVRRAPAPTTPRGAASWPAPAARAIPRPKPVRTVLEPLAPGLVARLEDLAPCGCRWPIGDPLTADFRYCGRPAQVRPYCSPHRAMAHPPARKRSAAAVRRAR